MGVVEDGPQLPLGGQDGGGHLDHQLGLAEGALLLGGSVYRDGDSSYDFGIVKLLEDGSTDLAFGSFGRRLVDFDPDDETGRYDRLLGLGRDGEDRLLLLCRSARESEERLRKVFQDAQQQAPSIIFIDEIDSIAPKREDAGGETERRVVAQLLTLLDGLEPRQNVGVSSTTSVNTAKTLRVIASCSTLSCGADRGPP